MARRRYEVRQLVSLETVDRSQHSSGQQFNAKRQLVLTKVQERPTEFQHIEQTLALFEAWLAKGRELTPSQMEELHGMTLMLIPDASPEARALDARLNRVKAVSLRLRTHNLIKSLENEYDRLEREFRLPGITPERKAELAQAADKIADTLQVLQR